MEIQTFAGQVQLEILRWRDDIAFGRGKDGREFVQMMLFAPHKYWSEYGEPTPKPFMVYDYRPEVVIAAKFFASSPSGWPATEEFAEALGSVPADIHLVTGPNGMTHIRIYPTQEPLPATPALLSLVTLESATHRNYTTRYSFKVKNHYWAWHTEKYDTDLDEWRIFFLSITDLVHQDEIVLEREEGIEVEDNWWGDYHYEYVKCRKEIVLSGQVSEGKWQQP